MPKFNKQNVNQVDNKKLTMYTLKKQGKPIYIGTAKRGRVSDRLGEHLGSMPGAEFSTRTFGTIGEARRAEENKIKREKPKYNI